VSAIRTLHTIGILRSRDGSCYMPSNGNTKIPRRGPYNSIKLTAGLFTSAISATDSTYLRVDDKDKRNESIKVKIIKVKVKVTL